jgi:hypothetical protein
MKSYSINRDHQRTSPLQAVPKQTTTSEKKGFVLKEHRKTFFALIALAIVGYLLVKLQKPGTHLQVAATSAAVEKAGINKSEKIQTETKKKINPVEAEKPTASLKAKLNWRKNLIGETILTGTLNNSATSTGFKDPVIVITWLSKTNAILGETTYPLNEYIAAGESVSYKLKVKVPFKYVDIKVSVKSATTLH